MTDSAYPWLKSYPDGVPHTIDPNKYSSIVDLLDRCIEKYTDSVAFECMGATITYRQLDEQSQHFAAYLLEVCHLKPGSRVALQMPNLLQYPITMLGALRAGMVVVNVNPLYTAREMKHQLSDSGADVIVILANFAHNLEKIAADLPLKHIIVTEIGDLLGGLKGTIVNLVVKHVKKMVPAYQLPQATKFKDVFKEGQRHTFKAPTIQPEDIAFLQYTGGTTGVAKGAVLTHTNLVANMLQITSCTGLKLKPREEVMITALPLYHIYALTVNCLSMLELGAKNVLITNPRDMKAFIKELKKQPFTVITGVNTLYNALLNHPDFGTIDFKHLKVTSAGGMAVQKVVAERWQAATGVSVTEGYGLTETSPVLTTNQVDGSERIGSIGLPVPNTQIIIADDDGNEVPFGEPGEIYAKGPQVMRGYWNRPDETKQVFTDDGWFKTGDVGVMGEDGFIKIVDRKKEMINVSGFNVYPNEIEEVVSGHAKVLEVGAIGVPNERSTEVVKVFVVKKDESLTEQELIAYCRENMTAYKVPKIVEFTTELPKSNVGKILRRLLRDREEVAVPSPS
ncbi:MAG: AMP-binding protein [Tunicatimonas sp.]